MPPPRLDTFEHMAQAADSWLADVAHDLGTDDLSYAYRVLCAWLHTLRDRLTVEAGARFAAHLPELVRGLYYEGCKPARVPMTYGAQGYIERFATDAQMSPADVAAAAAAVACAVRRHLSPEQFNDAVVQLPGPIRELVAGEAGDQRTPQPTAAADRTANGDRVDRIEQQVAVLTEAMRVMAQGLDIPAAEPDGVVVGGDGGVGR